MFDVSVGTLGIPIIPPLESPESLVIPLYIPQGFLSESQGFYWDSIGIPVDSFTDSCGFLYGFVDFLGIPKDSLGIPIVTPEECNSGYYANASKCVVCSLVLPLGAYLSLF